MGVLRRMRGCAFPFLAMLFLSGLAGCQWGSEERQPVSPVALAPILEVPSPRGPIDVLGHGSHGDGGWVQYRRGDARRDISFGRESLAGGAVRGFLSLSEGGAERVRMEVGPGPDPDRFVPRVWIHVDGRRREVDLDPLPGLALPPRILLPSPADVLMREAALVLSSSRVHQLLFGPGRSAKPSYWGGYDCVQAWRQMVRACVDPSNTHECTEWLVRLFSCILIALASL